MNFLDMLKEFKQNGDQINVGINGIGPVKVKIKDIRDDIIVLEKADGGNVFFMHYTNVVIIT